MLKLPESSSLRRVRVSEQGRIYLITAAVADRRPLFKDLSIGRLLVEQMRSAEESGLAHFLAWVIMPDHFHWLIELRSAELSRLMQRIKSRSALAVNRQLRLSGPVWQDGYHDIAVRREEHMLGFARYIVANPLRQGLVGRLGDYPLWDCVWMEGGDTAK